MTKIDLSIVNKIFLDDYVKTIDISYIKDELTKLTYDFLTPVIDNLEDIIKADIDTIETKYAIYITENIDERKRKKVRDIFNYPKYRKEKNFMSFFKKLNIKSCPFCNNNYIYFYKEESRTYNTIATLEHYYPKAKYPHLSLSFYNLIPSCYICNSKFKGSDLKHMGKIHHPYRDDFDEHSTFKISVNNSTITKDEDISIELNSNNTKCKTSIDRFQLDKIYKEHNNIAKEIWNKAQVYNESRLEELYKNFYKDLGYSKEDVKNMAFCNYLHKDNINKRNHAKLTQDILKQFDLIKEK